MKEKILAFLVVTFLFGGFIVANSLEKFDVVKQQDVVLTPVFFQDEVEIKPVVYNNEVKQFYECSVEARCCPDYSWQKRQPVRNIIKVPFRILQFIWRPRCR